MLEKCVDLYRISYEHAVALHGLFLYIFVFKYTLPGDSTSQLAGHLNTVVAWAVSRATRNFPSTCLRIRRRRRDNNKPDDWLQAPTSARNSRRVSCLCIASVLWADRNTRDFKEVEPLTFVTTPPGGEVTLKLTSDKWNGLVAAFLAEWK